MKYLKQLCIILFISFLGELLSRFIPLPIPASIYGLVLMLFALISGLVPLHAVKELSGFLIGAMQLMFIPAAVGLISVWGLIRTAWLKYLIIIAVTTTAVMLVSARVTQRIMRREGGKNE